MRTDSSTVEDNFMNHYMSARLGDVRQRKFFLSCELIIEPFKFLLMRCFTLISDGDKGRRVECVHLFLVSVKVRNKNLLGKNFAW